MTEVAAEVQITETSSQRTVRRVKELEQQRRAKLAATGFEPLPRDADTAELKAAAGQGHPDAIKRLEQEKQDRIRDFGDSTEQQQTALTAAAVLGGLKWNGSKFVPLRVPLARSRLRKNFKKLRQILKPFRACRGQGGVFGSTVRASLESTLLRLVILTHAFDRLRRLLIEDQREKIRDRAAWLASSVLISIPLPLEHRPTIQANAPALI